MALIKCLIFLSITLAALYLVYADEGTATFYTIYNPSACYGFLDEGTMIAAASEALWDDEAACGRMYKVTCTGAVFENDPQPCIDGASVNVKIVDLCPSPGCQGTIDLSKEAFTQIPNTDANKITITYELL